MERLRNLNDRSDEPTSTEVGEDLVSRATFQNDGAAVLELVGQAAELIRNFESRAAEREAQAHSMVLQTIEDMKFAERRVHSAEEQREASLATSKEYNAKAQEIEEELRRSEALLAAYELRLSRAEQQASGAEERANEIEKALMRVEHAIRNRLLGQTLEPSRDLAVAA
jgi:chromosome segregation ATPase